MLTRFGSWQGERFQLLVEEINKKRNISTESYVLQWFGQHLNSIVHEIIRFTTILLNKISDETPKWNPPVAGKVTLAALEALKPS